MYIDVTEKSVGEVEWIMETLSKARFICSLSRYGEKTRITVR